MPAKGKVKEIRFGVSLTLRFIEKFATKAQSHKETLKMFCETSCLPVFVAKKN